MKTTKTITVDWGLKRVWVSDHPRYPAQSYFDVNDLNDVVEQGYTVNIAIFDKNEKIRNRLGV